MSLTSINSDNVFMKDVIGNVRKAQEDSNDVAIMTPNGDAFIVCDGMGGHVGGKQASSIAVKCIIEYLKKEAYTNIEVALREALEFANTQIIFHAAAHPELRGMGTTACILLLKDDIAYVAHIGDSRIYLYLGEEQQLHRVTKDHSYVQALVDGGEITADEAENHPDKNRILKALGIQKNISPTINVVQPKKDDIFLICSDGLSDMLSDKEIRATFLANAPIKDTGESLIKQALYAGGLDNITVHLIRITNSPVNKSVFKSFTPRLKDPINPGKKIGPTTTGKSPKKGRVLLFGIIAAVCLVVIGITATIFLTNNETTEDKIERLNDELTALETEQRKITCELENDDVYSKLYERYKVEQETKSKDSFGRPVVSEGVKTITETENIEKLDIGKMVKVIFNDVKIAIKDDSIEKFVKFAHMVTDLEQVTKKINKIETELEEYKDYDDNVFGANQPNDKDGIVKKEEDNKENPKKNSTAKAKNGKDAEK